MLQQLLQEGDEEFRISGVVHVLDNISPLVLVYIARALLSQHGFDVAVGFEGNFPRRNIFSSSEMVSFTCCTKRNSSSHWFLRIWPKTMTSLSSLL